MKASTTPSVLLISDVRSEMESIGSALEPLEVELVGVGSEERDLRDVEGRDLALIVCSLSDSSVDECAVADRVRRHAADEKTPILFLTSAVQEERLLRCNDGAPVDVLLKPYDPAELRMRIRLFAGFHDIREDLETRIRERSRAPGEAEERLWLLLENFEDYAIFTMDRDGRVMEWGRGAERVFGYSAAEMAGSPIDRLFTPEDRREGRAQQELAEAAENGEAEDERWHLRKDGRRFYASGLVSALRDESGQLWGYAKIARDLTQQKQTEDALRESEERLRLVAEATNDLIWDWDIQSAEVLSSEALVRVYGYSARYLRASEEWWKSRIHPDDRERVLGGIARLMADDGRGWSDEYRFRRADNTHAHVFNRGNVLRDRAGKATRMIGSVVDLSNRYLVEEKIREAHDQAVEASRAKSQFLATMSHELRSPLTAIIGYAELLEEEMDEAGLARFKSDLGKIRAAGDHLRTLISDVLDLSKIEAGKLELETEDFGICESVEEAAAVAAPLLEKKPVELAVRCECGPQSMRGDQTRVRQILINLLSNAAKFTEKGRVEIVCRLETDGWGERWGVFEVSDTGIGISPKDIDRLFTKFQQLDASSTRRYGGSGMGLAISRLLCEMMGGTIGAQSELGRGSVFTVRLPLTAKPVFSTREAAP